MNTDDKIVDRLMVEINERDAQITCLRGEVNSLKHIIERYQKMVDASVSFMTESNKFLVNKLSHK